jgi:hypothetical protein
MGCAVLEACFSQGMRLPLDQQCACARPLGDRACACAPLAMPARRRPGQFLRVGAYGANRAVGSKLVLVGPGTAGSAFAGRIMARLPGVPASPRGLPTPTASSGVWLAVAMAAEMTHVRGGPSGARTNLDVLRCRKFPRQVASISRSWN